MYSLTYWLIMGWIAMGLTGVILMGSTKDEDYEYSLKELVTDLLFIIFLPFPLFVVGAEQYLKHNNKKI